MRETNEVTDERTRTSRLSENLVAENSETDSSESEIEVPRIQKLTLFSPCYRPPGDRPSSLQFSWITFRGETLHRQDGHKGTQTITATEKAAEQENSPPSRNTHAAYTKQ